MATQVEPFGIGVIRPLRRNPKGRFTMGGGQPLIASQVGQVLGMNPGECRWRPSMGANLTNLRQRLNTAALADLARVSVESAIRRWVPRAAITDVILAPPTKAADSQLQISVLWAAGAGRVSGVRVSA
jgi:phage baseplate assembly protein W